MAKKRNLLETIKNLKVSQIVEKPVEVTETSETAFLDSLVEDKVITTEELAIFEGNDEDFDAFLAELNTYHATITEETLLETVEQEARKAIEAATNKIKAKSKKMVASESVEEDENEKIDEDTDAAASIKAGAGAKQISRDPRTKFEYMATMIGAANALRGDKLTSWFKQSMALIGTEGSKTPAASDSNKSSIDNKPNDSVGHSYSKYKAPMPKIDCKEDVAELFSGEELSEEFKEKATTLFETAVAARIILEIANIDEQADKAVADEIAHVTEQLTDKVEVYLTSIGTKWLAENDIAIETQLRNELTEEFIDGLKTLFETHYIDVPADKINVLEQLNDKNNALEEKLDELMTENADLRSIMEESAKEVSISKAAEGLTEVEKEKFAALAEGIDYDGDITKFDKKLGVIKEQYFNKKTSFDTNIDEEVIVEDDDKVIVKPQLAPMDAGYEAYMNAVRTRTIGKKS